MALALVAAAVLVLSDNARWLRLAVVSALWAALVGAFLAARYRRQVADREDEVADLQSVYELELEREVAARREYELEIEAEARKRVQDESRDDLDKLREELRALRENLEALLGGEVLVERVALRAESTRMRSLSDQSRLMAVGDKRIISTENERVRSLGPGPTKAAAAKPAVVKKAPEKSVPVSDRTELIERVVVEASRKESRSEPPRREPARPEPARPEPNRQPNRTEPVRREPARTQQRSQPPIVVRRDPPKPPPERQPEPPRRPAEQPTSRVSRAELMDSMEVRLSGLTPLPPERRPEPMRRAEPAPKPAPPKPTPPKPAPPKVTPPPPQPPPSEPRRGRAAERTEMISPEPLLDLPPTSSRPPVNLPPTSSRTNLTPVAESAGGRRRADERPSWESLGSWESSREEPAARTGRRSAPDVDAPAGAHADGKSVSELLASLGNADSPRRRRRRED